ncbi:MAG: hypothetical protein IPO88_05480 [Nannocystis sp.]|uniref:hypothetical protein n=1 Tax=Nannocystis sp. TaxID=1962667 RepID=UPI002425279C|nr:hypothetical protein [Nannocystis sp.]MBK9752953.1 hypothetical protein [Nannocystis sp.]
MSPPRPTICLVLAMFVATCGPGDPPADDTSPGTTSTTVATTVTTTSETTTTTELPTSSSTSSTSTSASDSCVTFDPNSCGESIVTIDISPALFVFALEKSVSMVSDPKGLWDHDADDLDDDGQSDLDPQQPATPKTTRWASLHHAVDATLTNFDASLITGLSLFPSDAATLDYTPAACPVDDPLTVPLAAKNSISILAALPPADATDLKGASPGAAAIAVATAELAAADPAFTRHIVYVSDGAANCRAGSDPPDLFEKFDDSLLDQIAAATAQEITTHVVGIAIPDLVSPAVKDGEPDSVNNHDLLNQLATLGGAPLPGPDQFHAATRESDLLAALDAIARASLSCVVTLDPPPQFPDTTEINVNDIHYGRAKVTDCASEDGWHFLDDGVTAELCGLACRDFQQAGTLDANYRCHDTPC